jgi:hypothetical protein
MQVFKDMLYHQDGYAITAFINSRGELEYTVYSPLDGGFMELEDKEYAKRELTDLLQEELNTFLHKNKSTITIIGHEIRIVTDNGILIKLNDLDEEVDKISQFILDGNSYGEIFVKSKNLICSWSKVY